MESIRSGGIRTTPTSIVSKPFRNLSALIYLKNYLTTFNSIHLLYIYFQEGSMRSRLKQWGCFRLEPCFIAHRRRHFPEMSVMSLSWSLSSFSPGRYRLPCLPVICFASLAVSSGISRSNLKARMKKSGRVGDAKAFKKIHFSAFASFRKTH